MMRRIFFILISIILIVTYADAQESRPSQLPEITHLEAIQKNDRILILAPHPDDEAIGCAGIIQEAVKVGADIHVVYLTNGDHNQAAFIVYEKRITLRKGEFIRMGEIRRKEAMKAMKLLGLDEKDLIFLGYPDFGTFTIFRHHWGQTRPFRSWLTRISSVPYKENLSYGAPYKGESILNDLKTVLLKYKPNKIFVSHPADVNVDHKTFYLFLEVALADLQNQIPKPKIYPYLIHCIGWPLPRHYHPQLTLEPPSKFLTFPIKWRKFELTLEQLDKKHQAILCYKSQTESSAFYLLAFARKNELFGNYAEIDLSLPSAKAKPDQPKVNYSLKDDSLLISIEKSEKIKQKFSSQLYLFSYSYKNPFVSMPKICIFTKYNKFKVFDKRKKIEPEGVTLELLPQESILKIPLKILGEPDFILLSVKAYTGIPPIYATGFRKINIKR